MDRLAEALEAGGGLLVGRQHPRLAHAVRVARERGELRAVLRGIYAATEAADSFEVRVAALFVADPDAVLTGRSAAIAHGWTTARGAEVVEAASRRIQSRPHGYALRRRRIDPDQVVEEGVVRATNAELTALDLARGGDSSPLTDALRRGSTLDGLRATLAASGRRPGNTRLHAMLHRARDAPWSPPELAAHGAFRTRRITGWVANHAVSTPNGPTATALIDIALPHLRLGFEIDGWETHGTKEAFIRDRARDRALVALDWHIVRVEAVWVLDHPDEFAAFARSLIAHRSSLLGIEAQGSRRRRHPARSTGT